MKTLAMKMKEMSTRIHSLSDVKGEVNPFITTQILKEIDSIWPC